MDHKLVDERIQSMMKTIGAIKKGTGMEHVSPELYIAFYEAMERQLEGERVEYEELDVLELSEHYINKAIETLEQKKDIEYSGDAEMDLALNNVVLDRLELLYGLKMDLLKQYRNVKNFI